MFNLVEHFKEHRHVFKVNNFCSTDRQMLTNQLCWSETPINNYVIIRLFN